MKKKLFIFGVDGVSAAHVKREVAKGNLPGFKRLMDMGVFFNDHMSVFPTISPTCWNSIYTGAVPKVHGGTCQLLHDKRAEPTSFRTSYASGNIKAERFWDTASRAGKKTLLLCTCGAGASDNEMVAQTFGQMTISADSDGYAYTSGVPQQYFRIRGTSERTYQTGTTERRGDWLRFEEKTSMGEQIAENVFRFKVVRTALRYDTDEVESFTWTVITEEDGVRIGADEASARNSKLIKYHEWSDVLTRRLQTTDGPCTFHFRAYLENLDKETGEYVIHIPAAKNILKDVKPRAWCEEVMAIPEMHTQCWGDYLKNPDKTYESLKFYCNWRREMLKKAVASDEYDIIFDFDGMIDTTNHYSAGVYEGTAEKLFGYVDSERAKSNYKRSYEMIDQEISWRLDNVVDENTTFCVVSDHGTIGVDIEFNFMDMLGKAGLTTFTSDKITDRSWRNDHIDWSKTKAYCVGSCFVNVNLKGREPYGIVPPEEYDDVVRDIIRALQENVQTEDGKTRGLAFAVPGDQAGFIGQGGENCGDVVFGIIGSRIGGYFGGVHSVQIPSAKTKTGGDIRPICIVCGSAFKKGHLLERPTDLTDVAPTLCYAMGYPQPKDATGGVVFAAFKE